MDIHDVIVVGAGPVGLLTARLLGLAGHDVHVVERWPEPYPLPRAVHFDHEIGRLLQSAGLGDRVRAVSERVPDFYEWRNRDGDTLLRIDWSQDGACGWPVANFFSQPALEAVLAESVEELPNVRLSRGLEVVGLAERDGEVEVSVAGGTSERLRARYVVGCDGANSFVRRHLDTDLTDLGFDFDWLIVDVLPHDERDWSPMNWQLCDPVRPTTIVSGGPGRRRWEFMRLPGEDRAELDSLDTAWRMLAAWGRNPDNTTLERHAVYTFQARWADSWNRGRLLLAGDAAHLMPPFAGQGMCSGLRDAANLAWKLDRVLRGACAPELLDSYTSERREHLQHAISMSVALGRTICVLDEDEARERDRRMRATGGDPRLALPPMPPERLGPGAWDTTLTPEAVQGQLTPQFRVSDGDASGLLDDLVDTGTGPGFTLIGLGVDPAAELTGEQLDVLDVLGVRSLVLVDEQQVAQVRPAQRTRRLVAHDGRARDWFAAAGASVVLVRPDFYAYGAVEDPRRVGVLVERLHADLGATTPVRGTPVRGTAYAETAAG
ncbi:monooxygenase [Pseudonocardia sp. CNS-004]|nr:monooxygenase [Pseudonocardia sp. CNS-004]